MSAEDTKPAAVDKVRSFILFLALFTAVVMTTIAQRNDMITPTDPTNQYPLNVPPKRMRITLWVIETCVGNAPCTSQIVDEIVSCDEYVRRLKAAECFSIIAIIVAAVGSVFGVYEYHGKPVYRYATLGAAFLFTAVAIIPWGIVAGLHHREYCFVTLKDNHDLGDGFAQLLASWIFVVVAGVFWMLRGAFSA